MSRVLPTLADEETGEPLADQEWIDDVIRQAMNRQVFNYTGRPGRRVKLIYEEVVPVRQLDQLSPKQHASMFIEWCASHGFGTAGWPEGAYDQLVAHLSAPNAACPRSAIGILDAVATIAVLRTEIAELIGSRK